MSGKGSARRPLQTSRDQFDEAWDRIFEKKCGPKEPIKFPDGYAGAPERRTVDDIYEEWFTRSKDAGNNMLAHNDKSDDIQHQSSVHLLTGRDSPDIFFQDVA
jgi:hypothetical protein